MIDTIQGSFTVAKINTYLRIGPILFVFILSIWL